LNGISPVLGESRLRSRRLSLSAKLNEPVVPTSRDVVVPIPALPKRSYRKSRVCRRKSAPVSIQSARILTVVFGPTPWNFATGGSQQRPPLGRA
jgi:hypothetical protein